jgi:hypothetical protein
MCYLQLYGEKCESRLILLRWIDEYFTCSAYNKSAGQVIVTGERKSALINFKVS